MVIRSSVFKHPKLVFVAELLIRRPDLAETVHEVMHKVGAGHLLEDL